MLGQGAHPLSTCNIIIIITKIDYIVHRRVHLTPATKGNFVFETVLPVAMMQGWPSCAATDSCVIRHSFSLPARIFYLYHTKNTYENIL